MNARPLFSRETAYKIYNPRGKKVEKPKELATRVGGIRMKKRGGPGPILTPYRHKYMKELLDSEQ